MFALFYDEEFSSFLLFDLVTGVLKKHAGCN